MGWPATCQTAVQGRDTRKGAKPERAAVRRQVARGHPLLAARNSNRFHQVGPPSTLTSNAFPTTLQPLLLVSPWAAPPAAPAAAGAASAGASPTRHSGKGCRRAAPPAPPCSPRLRGKARWRQTPQTLRGARAAQATSGQGVEADACCGQLRMRFAPPQLGNRKQIPVQPT